jgi:hypothetical protein
MTFYEKNKLHRLIRPHPCDFQPQPKKDNEAMFTPPPSRAGLHPLGMVEMACAPSRRQAWLPPIPGLVAICSEKNEKKYGSSPHPAQPIGCFTWSAWLAGIPESILFH